MGLAKYMEDNLERLYASLEDSRRRVSSVDENSTDKDWKLIKNRLEKELTLVSKQYDELLKIVTNPQFDDFTELYEENIALNEKLIATQKQNDILSKSLAHCNCTIGFMRNDIFNIQLVLKDKEKHLLDAHKVISKSEQIIKDIKSEMIPIKNSLNNNLQRLHNSRIKTESLISEIEIKNEKIATLELLIDSPEQSIEILSIKDDETVYLKTKLYGLHDWCELLEIELSIERPVSLALSTNRISRKNKHYEIKTPSSFLNLTYENEQLKSQVDLINQTASNQEELIAEKESCISKLKNKIIDSVRETNDLKNINFTLRSQLESFQKSKLEEDKQIKEVTSSRKIVTKKYDPPKKTIPPLRNKGTYVSSRIRSKQTAQSNTENESLAKKNSQQQFDDYLNRYKKS